MDAFTRAQPATHVDIAWQIAYRLGFPLARLWWRVWRGRHQGALVAVHVGQSLLLLRSSYRTAWNFPGGGIRPGEGPEMAARRELSEEIGLIVDAPLRPLGTIHGVWEGRRETVFLFGLGLDRLPILRLDNREIIDARFVPLDEIDDLRLTASVRAFIEDLLPRLRNPTGATAPSEQAPVSECLG